jgi:MYXO-CTERM domain-containing protein
VAVRLTHSYGIGTEAANGSWSYNETGYVGFKFTSDGNTHFGWASVTIGGSNRFTFNEAWYNSTPGASITAGQTSAVPEPSTYAVGLGALALGAAGVRRWRQRKAVASK